MLVNLFLGRMKEDWRRGGGSSYSEKWGRKEQIVWVAIYQGKNGGFNVSPPPSLVLAKVGFSFLKARAFVYGLRLESNCYFTTSFTTL